MPSTNYAALAHRTNIQCCCQSCSPYSLVPLQKARSQKGKAAEKSPQEEEAPSAVRWADVNVLNQKITDQGNLIRKMKQDKADKVGVLACWGRGFELCATGCDCKVLVVDLTLVTAGCNCEVLNGRFLCVYQE